MIGTFTLAKAAKAIGIRGFAAIGLGLALIFVVIRAHGLSGDLEADRKAGRPSALYAAAVTLNQGTSYQDRRRAA